jgi:hypothetical protein
MLTAVHKWVPLVLFFAIGWTGGSWWSSLNQVVGPAQQVANVLPEPFAKVVPTTVSATAGSAWACTQAGSQPRNGDDILNLLRAGYLSDENMDASLQLMTSSPEAFEAISRQFLSTSKLNEKERLHWMLNEVQSPLRSQLARQMLGSQDAFDRTSAYEWISADVTYRSDEKLRLLIDASRKETSGEALAQLVSLLPAKSADGQGTANPQLTERLKELSVNADHRVARNAVAKLATQEANPTAWAQVESMLFSTNVEKQAQALDALSQYTANSWNGPVRSWVEQLSKDGTLPADIRARAQTMLKDASECS